MTRPRLEVADVFRAHGDAFLDRYGDTLSPEQRRALRDITACRTAALGGHVEECDRCGHQRVAYNSCRNRHCPKCQATAAAEWMEDRESELLPVEYFQRPDKRLETSVSVGRCKWFARKYLGNMTPHKCCPGNKLRHEGFLACF
jgi:hypothetical protein